MKITKILKELFEKIFKKNKTLKIDKVKFNSKAEERNIKEELKVSNDFKILKLQNEYEAGAIKESQMSNNKIKKLIELYQKQINELDYELAIRKKS